MFISSLILLTIIAAIAWYRVKYRRRNYLLSKIPYPRKLPLVHNTLDFIGKSPKELFDWMEDTAAKLGRVYHFTIGIFDSGFAVVSDVKIAEALLSSQVHLDKTVDYDLLKPWIGTGLLVSTSTKWFQRRKLLTPGFHFQILEKFVEIMNEQANVFVTELTKHDGKEVDIFPMANLFALDTVCEAAMGINIHAQTKQSNYVKAVKEITTIMMIKSFDTTKQMEILYKFSDMKKRKMKLLLELHSFTDDIIQSRRDELLSQKSQSPIKQDEIGTKKKKALLDILLSSTIDGQPLSNLDIREEVDTFMFAGHDTTTSGISFVLYCIAKYPDVQQKIYEEVAEVLGDDDNVTLQKLQNLRYLELVIKESLRLFPPVPYYGRKLSEELVTEDYTFPKDMNLYLSPYLMRTNEELFEEPLKFNPHRFEMETTYDKINPFSYIPFSAGPRNCIGQKFAQYELRTIAAKIVKNYKLTLAAGQENLVLTSELVMRPLYGIIVNVEKRN